VLHERSVAHSLTDSLLFELWDCLSDYEARSGLGARLRRAFAAALHVERVLESVNEAVAAALRGRCRLAKHTAIKTTDKAPMETETT